MHCLTGVDIQEKNILLGLDDNTAMDDCIKFEQQELDSPSPRKIDGDRVIHTSRSLVPRIYEYGRPVLCDLGEARFGKYDPSSDIQPYQYRAPEVILDMPWDHKADIWNVGVLVRCASCRLSGRAFTVRLTQIWDLFENGNLFKTTGGPENKEDNIYHLAHMIALLGPPPKDFVERTQTGRPWGWFDEKGGCRSHG